MKKITWILSVAVVVVLILFFSGNKKTEIQESLPASDKPYTVAGNAVPKGDRIFEIHVGPAEDGDYDNAFSIAKKMGIDSVPLSLNWNDIESSPEKYKNEYLEIANMYYPQTNTKVSLVIKPVDTNGKQVPKDLMKKSFDDPVMVERFNKLMDYVFSQLPDVELASLSIGNEVDYYLAGNNLVDEYKVFYEKAVNHAKTKRANLKVGVTSTFEGLTGNVKEQLKKLNEKSDVVMVTYYPMDENSMVREPTTVLSDFDKLIEIYPDKPIYFKEIGYPSSSILGSSEEKQSDFIRESFKAWDARASKIKLLSFLGMYEWSKDEADELSAYYGFSDQKFQAYLMTLGLRIPKGSGVDKEGFKALRAEAKARGWGIE